MTADEKFQKQLHLAGQVFQQYMDFPVGKAIMSVGAVWLAYLYSDQIELKMLACIPVISFFDYVTGTIRALVIKRHWTPAASTMGMYRWFVWTCLILLFYLVSLVVGRWIWIGIIGAIFTTELTSLLENIRQTFPGSKLSLFLAVVLQVFNRKYLDVINEFASIQAQRREQEKEKKVEDPAPVITTKVDLAAVVVTVEEEKQDGTV